MGIKITKQGKLIVAALAVFYVLLRFWRLTDSCLWFDEIFSVHAAEHLWSEIIPFIAKDLIHPPLFYLLLKVLILVGGDGLFWLRLLPVIFSILALFPLWMLCRELKLRPSAVVVSFGLFAVNGALIKYAQEVRMYSLLLFVSLTSIWLFSRYYFRGKSFWMLVVVNILLVHTHYFGWFVVGSEIFLILIFQRIKVLRTLLMLAVTAAAFVPWILALLKFAEPGSSIEQNIGWMQRPGIGKLFELIFDLVDPLYFQQSSAEPAAFYWIAVPILILIVTSIILYFIDFGDEKNKDRLFFLATFAAVPAILVFILSWLMPVSIWGSRHLIIMFAPVILLMSIFLTEIGPEFVRRGLIAGVFLLAATAFVLQLLTPQQRPIWCAWEGLAREWILAPQDSSQPKKLYVFEDLIAYHYWFATRSLPGYRVTLLKGVEGVQNDPAYFLPRGFDSVSIADLTSVGEDEIWISYRKPTGNSGEGESFINDGFNRSFDSSASFERMGYKVADVKRDVVGSQTAYLIRMTKTNTPSER